MRKLGSVAVAAAVTATALTGCASAKDKWIDSTDAKCAAITKRFTSDLAWGDGIGQDDLSKMDQRVRLIERLREQAGAHPPSEVKRSDLNAWLNKLRDYAKETGTMRKDVKEDSGGFGTAMEAGIVQDAAEATRAPAQSLGLDECTHVGAWEKIG